MADAPVELTNKEFFGEGYFANIYDGVKDNIHFVFDQNVNSPNIKRVNEIGNLIRNWILPRNFVIDTDSPSWDSVSIKRYRITIEEIE